MRSTHIYCKYCDSDMILYNYQKEILRMEVRDIECFGCCDCGKLNYIEKVGEDEFEHIEL